MQRSTQETRRWAFYSLGARMCEQDTGRVHGPVVQHARSPFEADSTREPERAPLAHYFGKPKREFQRCVVVPANVERCMWEV